MRIRLIIVALLCAICLPAGASAAGFSGYCAQPELISQDRPADSAQGYTTTAKQPQGGVDDPLLQVTPVAQYACSNRCRRGCYAASQSCRASARACRRRLSACIRRCGC